ncbi:unnamed protein product [Hermetia illucens]|uniref:Uncharacterized protein n=1 Tax=Hermetia illucens TaxID=343691 RepID=A0A7R8V098_HERIL|nr:uncharacterized protein LOC119657647 [Hermetia illucens]CAD7090208.1 unnamed protein product [Hermetia illucens]
MLRNWSLVVILAFGIISYSEAVPKYETPSKQYDASQWKRSYYNDKVNETAAAESSNERIQRFGFATGYGGINGYPNSGTGVASYSPVKLDLGGVVLGTLLGIGAILIIPKLVTVFSGGYGQYARSTDDEMSTLTEMLNKIDEVLGQNNIDSTNCMQRAVCAYLRSTESSVKTGAADQIDQFVHTLSRNSLVDYMLDGTAIKEALENGKNVSGKECDVIYSQCPLDSTSAMKIVTKLLPNNSN